MLTTASTVIQSYPNAQTGVELGSVLAVVCSWERNKSILWAILAAIFSWFYVLYFALTRRTRETNRGLR